MDGHLICESVQLNPQVAADVSAWTTGRFPVSISLESDFGEYRTQMTIGQARALAAQLIAAADHAEGRP
jgi:hypothetical protein